MKHPMGQHLLEENVITEEQLKKAMERQRLHGGGLGHSLVSLGYLSSSGLDAFFNYQPAAPKTMKESGLDISFIADLIMKHILHMGEFKLSDLEEAIRLPASVLDPAIERLRREKLIEVRGAAEYVKSSFNFTINEAGKAHASELFEVCQYTGPAPVPLEDYNGMVELQTITNTMVDEARVKEAFSDLIIDEKLLKRLGPAISSGHPMFIYGPPGNGKTTISETIGKVLPDSIFIPHAILVGGQIIVIFDPVNHMPSNGTQENADFDRRWIQVKRPVIITGGELTLKTLDLEFNSIAKYYEAPLQMKANNGLFIVDDFGRQQIDPQQLLNRWIVNLDRKIDFLALHTGMKFEIPFDQLVIFATNIEPRTLVDEAFLRRIRYKIRVGHPSQEEYQQIFQQVCRSNDVEFRKDIFDYLLKNYYKRLGVHLNACHPRDIVNHILDEARYHQRHPELTREGVDMAWENYFVEM